MSQLELPEDFRDLLVALADAGAEFVLLGGWAMAVHGRPRATEDLDVLVRANPTNSNRIFDALVAYGAPVGAHGVNATTFESEGPAYRLGVKPLCIEVLTKVSGIAFDDARQDALHTQVDGRDILVIGREALLRNKRAAGRHKDLDDVEWLEAHQPTL